MNKKKKQNKIDGVKHYKWTLIEKHSKRAENPLEK